MEGFDDVLDRMRREVSEAREGNHHSLISALLNHASTWSGSADAVDTFSQILEHPFARRSLAPITSPDLLVRFAAQLVSRLSPKSILDPTCGCGLMLRQAIVEARPEIAVGVELDPQAFKVARLILSGSADVIEGDVLRVGGEQLEGRFDLILSDPPMGARVVPAANSVGPSTPSMEFAEQLVLWCLRRLSPTGIAVVVVSPRLATSHRFHERVRAAGAQIKALIHMPAGTRRDTMLPCYLAVFGLGEQGRLFVAQLDRQGEGHKELLDNMLASRAGPHPGLGALCMLEAFGGFERLDADFRIALRLKGSHFRRILGSQAFVSVERLHAEDASHLVYDDVDPNVLYLRADGTPFDGQESRVRTSAPSLKLQLNPHFVHRDYFRSWLKSELGKHVLRSIGAGSLVPLVGRGALLQCELPLPPIEEQIKISAALTKIGSLRKEMAGLEESCWSGRERGDSFAQKVDALNKAASYEDWIESLPFPLAIILRRHLCSSAEGSLRYQSLVHFFEALAAFLATVHLSAFRFSAAWEEHQPALVRAINEAKHRIRRPTFGTWMVINDHLSKRTRLMLADSQKMDAAKEMYAVADMSVLDSLASIDLLAVLKQANEIRNSYLGHGGAIGSSEAAEIERTLLGLVDRVRNIFGGAWQNYQLVLGSTSRRRNGIHHQEVPLLMGTRTVFPPVKLETREALEEGEMYLIGEGASHGLRLLPLVRMRHSPANVPNACYFFNRVQDSGLKFVSYHFEEQSQILEEFGDTRVIIGLLERPVDDSESGASP